MSNFLKSFYQPINEVELKLFSQGKCGVYLFENSINKHCYIGSALSNTTVYMPVTEITFIRIIS